MSQSPCKGCGKLLVWARLPDGGTVPLDPRAPVYRVEEIQGTNEVAATRSKDHLVSHFATCPKASDFSRSKKNSTAPPWSREIMEEEGGDW